MTGLTALLVLALSSVAPSSIPTAAGQAAGTSSQKPAIENLKIQGKLVCLSQSDRRAADVHECGAEDRFFGLQAIDGMLYRFSSSDPLIEMFRDSSVKERTLQLTVRPANKNEVELVKVQSLREGRLFDLYYFCDVCNITAYAGGPCPCCGKDFEFVEAPAQAPDL